MSSPKLPEQVVIDWRAVGRRIRELRGYDTKQSQVAEVIGVAQSRISAVENGQGEAGALILLRLARYYGKSVEWLLTGEDT
jgi:transcriptional regulator with XRE-family HTH domain